ncbi:MAG: hypothetical protein JJU06_15545 [Ectothiorhodospiraceae bacterium]|nr:hypothetical protein [Ectothiorhodospiraceae bacterium]
MGLFATLLGLGIYAYGASLVVADRHWLVWLGYVGGGVGMFGILVWAVYSVIIAYKVVPKADAFIEPNPVGNDLLFRHFRAINYGGACTFRWANRRTLDFDCRTLPAEIRYPLMVQFAGLLISFVLFFGGALLFAIADRLGHL